MPRPSDDTRAERAEKSRPKSFLVGLWLTALALTLLSAGSVVDAVVYDSGLGSNKAMVGLTNALARLAEITRAERLSESARGLASAVKPEIVWLRAAQAAEQAPPAQKAASAPRPSAPTASPSAGGGVVPAARATKAEPTRVLIIGASSIQLHFGAEIERTLRSSYKNLVVKRFGKLATGLVRPDYFDWPKKARELVHSFKPDLVIAQFGGNDVQGISRGRQAPLSFGTPEWDEEFGARVMNLIELAQSHGARMVIMDMPMMQSPKFSKNIQHVNEIMAERARHAGSGFLSIWDLSADPSGGYTNSIELDGKKRLLRESDGVHFTRDGAIYMARKVGEWLEREQGFVPVTAPSPGASLGATPAASSP